MIYTPWTNTNLHLLIKKLTSYRSLCLYPFLFMAENFHCCIFTSFVPKLVIVTDRFLEGISKSVQYFFNYLTFILNFRLGKQTTSDHAYPGSPSTLSEGERSRPSSSRFQPCGVTKYMSFKTSITIKQDILESKVRSV